MNLTRLLAVVLFFVALSAEAQYTSAGLEFPTGIESGTASDCEAPVGKTCYWVDCDAGVDGTGTYASPFWGFETVFGYYNAGHSYVQGVAVGGDVIYVTGTCEVTGSEDDATGPYKQIRIARSAQVGTASEPTIIKSWRGVTQAVFNGEYTATLATPVAAENNPSAGLIRVEQSAAGNSYIKFQNIKIHQYHTDGIRVEYLTEGVTINSITCSEGRVDPTGTQGCIARTYNSAIVYADEIKNSYFVNNNHTCSTYVGDSDATCTPGNNDGTISLTTEPSASNGSTVNIHNNLDISSAKFVHQKHNGNVTVNIYQNWISDNYNVVHLRAKKTNFYYNIVDGVDNLLFELDPENETLNVSLSAYNNSIYTTTGQLLGDIESWQDDGTIEIYNNAIVSSSSSTPFMFLGQYSGEYVVRASFTMDHNYFNVPAGVQSSFSCLGPSSSGGACTTRNFTDTKTELSDSTSATTDPLFTNPGSDDFTLQVGASSRTAGRSGTYLGAIDPGGGGGTTTTTTTTTTTLPAVSSALNASTKFRKGMN